MSAIHFSHLPQENEVVIPKSWNRYLLPRRGIATKPPSPCSEKSARELALEVLTKAVGISGIDPTLISLLQSEAPLDGEDIQSLGTSLDKVHGAGKAQRAWIDWSIRDLGLIPTLQQVLSVASRHSLNSPERRHDEHLYQSLRHYLATTNDGEYNQAVELAESYRSTCDSALGARLCFLFPEKTDWLEQELQRTTYRDQSLLVATVTDPETAAKVLEKVNLWALRPDWCPNLYANLISELGLASGPLLSQLVVGKYLDSDGAKSIARALACIPEESAFLTLHNLAEEHKGANESLHQAAEQFPRLAMSCLSSLKSRASLIRNLIGQFPDLLEACHDDLNEAQKNFLNQLSASTEDEPEPSTPKDWPQILRQPRWLAPKSLTTACIKIKPRYPEPRIEWKEGERESWQSAQPVLELEQNLYEFLKTVPTWQRDQVHTFRHLVVCPRQAGLELIEDFVKVDPYYIHDHIKAVIARWELHALPLVQKALRSHLADIISYISPYDDGELCLRAAEAYGRLKATRKVALEYLLRYPETAALALIPDYLGKKKKPQQWAQSALLALSLQGQSSAIEKAALHYGEEVLEALRPLLAMDALDNVPDKIPDLPTWFHEAAVKKPVLQSGLKALGGDGLKNFVTMLAISKPGEVYAGVAQVAEKCTPASLSRFAWSLFESWMEGGSDSKSYWALHALGWLGDDDVVRKLTPLLKKWPGEGGHARAVQGLEVLTAIGTDISLMHLFGLSQKLKFKGLKQQAAEKVREIADNRGLTTDELGDRLVPDLGLGANGALILNYGPREFCVEFDEKLKPVVRDENGKVKASLPKPNRSDDAELSHEAFERFKILKKDAKAVASQQLIRLENALIKQRRWSTEQFTSFFLNHPLVIHLARRLVWGLYQDGALEGLFRVAEDGTLADLDDAEFHLPRALQVGLVHPLELTAEQKESWAEILGDYQVLQPFPQLEREVFHFQDDERQETELKRVEGSKIESVRLLSLESRGWRRGEALDGGVVHWMSRELAPDLHVYLNFEDGLVIGDPNMFPHQTLRAVTLQTNSRAWGAEPGLPFGRLSEAAFSEVVRDLETLIP
jgi:Domain of unknown function (DUF4132)